jgi:hypothetical protein
MIDKARASQAGTLGTYYRYPCPIDAACLELLGIDAHTFREIANEAVDDQAVIDQLAAIGAGAEHILEFDPSPDYDTGPRLNRVAGMWLSWAPPMTSSATLSAGSN